MYIISNSQTGKELFWTGFLPNVIIEDKDKEKWTDNIDLAIKFGDKNMATIENIIHKLGEVKMISKSTDRFS